MIKVVNIFFPSQKSAFSVAHQLQKYFHFFQLFPGCKKMWCNILQVPKKSNKEMSFFFQVYDKSLFSVRLVPCISSFWLLSLWYQLSSHIVQHVLSNAFLFLKIFLKKYLCRKNLISEPTLLHPFLQIIYFYSKFLM